MVGRGQSPWRAPIALPTRVRRLYHEIGASARWKRLVVRIDRVSGDRV